MLKDKVKTKEETKVRIRRRIRRKLRGSAERPRVYVFKSNRYIYTQAVNDENGTVLAAASTLEKDFDGTGTTVAAAATVGKLLAERAKAAGVSKVVFDRGGFLFHGRVKALADAAREGGLEF